MLPPAPPVLDSIDSALDRYSRQVLFPKIGVEGQRRLGAAKVVLFGCGALGTVLADILVRAGVGFLRICDRDFVERDNLQRQMLFDEDDVASDRPKAQAAASKLRRINSTVTIDPVVVDVNHRNIEQLADGADVLLDGTDNFETRFLINDLAVKTLRPWIYGAVVGATGLSMTIIPQDTPCLRCIFEEPPPPEMNFTCDTAGVLGPGVHLIAGIQAVEAIKLLVGATEDISRHLIHLDVWSGRLVQVNVQSARDKGDCPCCKRRDFAYLDGRIAGKTVKMCGRNAVQVHPGSRGQISFPAIARKLGPVASAIRYNSFLLKAVVENHELTVFADGRAIVKGTEDPDKARTLYGKYIGS